MPRSKGVNYAFAESQRELIRLAPFAVTIWNGKVMGNYPQGVRAQVLKSCVDKGVLVGVPDGIKLVYQLTLFGKQVLTLIEAYDKMQLQKMNARTQGDQDEQEQPLQRGT